MNRTKISRNHLNRQAIVYLRQSTLRQVVEHAESTKRQYALAGRAEELGWSSDAVEIIDEDLGRSGSTTEARAGFRRLADQVGKGQIGALFALEVSRFARCSADWHHLLDLCGWADVLIIDEQGIFDPKDPNDRLLLGLKGQMSEAEKYWMKMRMHGAKLSRARRGELRLVPPIGYAWDPAARCLTLDPDEQVQAAIRLVFERFRTEGSSHGLRAWFMGNNLKLPVHHRGVDIVRWVNPRPSTVLDILHSPIYTGAYVYGRRESRSSLVEGVRRTSVVTLPRDQWRVFLPGRHPAYLSWEEYLENQDTLMANRTSPTTPRSHRAALDGAALLQGMVLCGKCGARMHTCYAGRNRRIVYKCRSPEQSGTSMSACWSVAGATIDAQVASAFLTAAQPPELELALAVSSEAQRQAGSLDEQWRLRIERARYDARHAERRYKAVDPDNRIVARTLERQWEEKLRDLDEAEREYERARQHKKVDLGEHDRQRILELAQDLPSVWKSSSTSHRQRKNLLRILVRDVTLTPIDVPERGTRVQILWDAGVVTEHRLARIAHVSGTQVDKAIEDRLRVLVERGRQDNEIAESLNADGLSTGMANRWSAEGVARVRRRLRIARPGSFPANIPLPERRTDGLYSARGVAARFGVARRTVHGWVKNGRLAVAERGGPREPFWFDLDEATVERLEVHLRTWGSKRSKPHGRGAS